MLPYHVASSAPRDPLRYHGEIHHCPTMHRSLPAVEDESVLISGLHSVSEVSCPNDQLVPASNFVTSPHAHLNN